MAVFELRENAEHAKPEIPHNRNGNHWVFVFGWFSEGAVLIYRIFMILPGIGQNEQDSKEKCKGNGGHAKSDFVDPLGFRLLGAVFVFAWCDGHVISCQDFCPKSSCQIKNRCFF